MKSLNITQGDEVITTAMTFCSTVNCIIQTGAKPVLCDVDPITKNIIPEQIIKNITSKTKAIIPVHFAGFPCDMDKIMEIAKEYNLLVIEDCAHAIEAQFKGKIVEHSEISVVFHSTQLKILQLEKVEWQFLIIKP